MPIMTNIVANIIRAILLAIFAIWFPKQVLNENNPDAEKEEKKRSIIRRGLALFIIFLGSFAFINLSDEIKPTTSQTYLVSSNEVSSSPRKTSSAERPKAKEPIKPIDEPSEDLVAPEDPPRYLKKQMRVTTYSGLSIDLYNENDNKIDFSHVAGNTHAKEELEDILKYIQDPKSFTKLGAKLPKGLLLYGPPGTGKTLLARALAGESKTNFLSVSGSQFDEKYVGVGAARVRELFYEARKRSPAIIFIDEIDALAGKRDAEGANLSGRFQTVNQLLTELDGLGEDINHDIFIIGATNRLESLDQAILRPGRFGRHVKVNLPSYQERMDILKVHTRPIKISANLNFGEIADRTNGYSGADLSNLANEAAIYATRKKKHSVDLDAFIHAIEKHHMGARQAVRFQGDLNVEILNANDVKTSFKDVAGLSEPKKELEDFIQYMRNPEDFGKLGAKPPKGVLLYGPPGNGKTLLARAIAGESNYSFIAVSGSDFEEQWVGVGAKRVRELFNIARQQAPAIIFIDEIDAIAFARGSGMSAHATNVQTVNQLLAEMDNINSSKNKRIFFIAASNRINALDPAILRPGRFDRQVKIPLPTKKDRIEILNLYLKNVTFKKEVTAEQLSTITPGFSGAELSNLINEAAIYATKAKKSSIDMESFEEAKDKMQLGLKLEDGTVSKKELKVTAYHESGHALVAYYLPAYPSKINKITVQARGHALGFTEYQESADNLSRTRAELDCLIASLLGGRIAEELIFGETGITTGASSDLERATAIAKQMVVELGFSENLGLANLSEFNDAELTKEVAREVNKILQINYETAKAILKSHLDKLHLLAKTLLKQGTVTGEEMERLLH